MQADIAIGSIDTTFVRYDSVRARPWHSRQGPVPAFYGYFKSAYGIPVAIDMAFIAPGFYSPLSFAAPSDAFYPFGSNLAAPGKFIGRGEASPYAQNMAGAAITVSPDIGFKHFKISCGYHTQIEAGRDIIFFPYRLNGMDFSTFTQSSYNRWGLDLLDVSMPRGKPYSKRLGDESFGRTSDLLPKGPDAGGIRQDYLSLYEGFVPYECREQADSNMHHATAIFTRSDFVPRHKKRTYNLEVNGAWDIGTLINYRKEFSLSFYGAINGIAARTAPIAFGRKNQLLWSVYTRIEPALSLSNRFYMLGLAGFENWKSEKAWMKNARGSIERCPIDFLDIAYGAGFDWEMVKNVGLHCRFKWMKHHDVYFSKNDWETPVISLETKMVF